MFVPNQIIHKVGVEFIHIKKFIGMVVNIFLLDGAVESFTVGVHLWASRIGMVVCNPFFKNFFGKMFSKFRAIIRLQMLDSERKDDLEFV